jgi:hypothetical protein
MAYLEHHLDVHPEELAPLQAAAKAGGLHVVGGGMTSPDTLLPETELLLRDYLFGIQFAEDTVGAHPTAAWLPDSFGHAGSAPDVLAAAGFQSVAFSRVDGAPTLFESIFHGDPPPKPGSTAALLLKLGSADFTWKGPGGGSVLAHFMAAKGLYCLGDNIDYAESIQVAGGHTGDFSGDDTSYTDGQIDAYAAAMAPYTKTPYVFVPVGCDFAHPKPQLISYLDGYNQRRYPTTGVWAVAAPFDTYAELVGYWKDVLPSLTVDLTPYYMGFYGSRADVKLGARTAARPYFLAETYATALGAHGATITQAAAASFKLLTRANHHDFIPGTAADDVVSTEEMPLLATAQAAGQAELATVAAALAARIPLQPGAVARVLALNASSLARTDVAEVELPPQKGLPAALSALADGVPVPLEIVGTGPNGGAMLRLSLATMAPFSWRAVDLVLGAQPVTASVTLSLEDASGQPATGSAVRRVVLANAAVQATWTQATNGFALTSLKLAGSETLAGDSVLFQDYADMGGLWRLGQEMQGCTLTPVAPSAEAETVEVVEQPGLTARVVFHGPTADREAWLDAGATGLSLAVTTGAAMATTRTVTFSLAVPATAALTTSEPAGFEVRPAERLYTPTFWPAVGWAQVGGLAVLLRQSTGVRMSTPGALELMAARDARAEQCDVEGGSGSDTGTHRIEWRIEPAATPAEAEQRAQTWNRPVDLEVVPLTQATTLDLPRESSLLGVSGAGIVSAIKPADRGAGIIVRALLLQGPVTLALPPALVGKKMTRVDIAERDLAPLGTAGATVVLDPATYGVIASIRLE